MTDLAKLLKESVAQVAAMSSVEKEEMIKAQSESWARAEASWPKAKFKWINGVKVYNSYEDYCND